MLLDAGVLVSIDRGERQAQLLLTAFQRTGTTPHTTHAVVAQVWRDGSRQSNLARFLRASIVHSLDDGRIVGAILAKSGTSDVVDAHLVAVAVQHGLPILTGDRNDIEQLVDVLGARTAVLNWP